VQEERQSLPAAVAGRKDTFVRNRDLAQPLEEEAGVRERVCIPTNRAMIALEGDREAVPLDRVPVGRRSRYDPPTTKGASGSWLSNIPAEANG
jgi:hypothetical protein